METLSAINAAENARRARARDYEEAKSSVENLQRKVTRLSATPHADSVTRLKRIIEDASNVPDTIIASVGGLIPISGVAQTFLVAIASDALRNVEQQDARRREDLKATKASLSAAEEHLASFTE